jgi:hypothetical protein
MVGQKEIAVIADAPDAADASDVLQGLVVDGWRRGRRQRRA